MTFWVQLNLDDMVGIHDAVLPMPLRDGALLASAVEKPWTSYMGVELYRGPAGGTAKPDNCEVMTLPHTVEEILADADQLVARFEQCEPRPEDELNVGAITALHAAHLEQP